jgi:hypothetical protein
MLAPPFKIRELEQRAMVAEAALEELKEEFEEYKLDKAENERILLEQFERTRDNLNESRYSIGFNVTTPFLNNRDLAKVIH